MSKPKHTLSGGAPEDGHWNESAPAQIDPASGQHKDHWVLPPEELAKGFVRPLRISYEHVGLKPPTVLEDLTAEELERYAEFGYVKHEPYPRNETCVSGRFWTQKQLDELNACGTMTKMPVRIAETWARDPSFYGRTFCARCGVYRPVEEFVWDGTKERLGS